MKRLVAAVALAGSLAAADTAAAAPEHYDFDKRHTSILFFINHLGFSYVQGEFLDYDGELVFDPDDVANSRLRVAIKTASVDTDVDKLDDHLRNQDFFHVDKFPAMTFVSTKVEKTGDNTGRVTGDLTILGVTRPVTMEVRLNKAGEHPVYKKWAAGFSATATVKRSEFGMTYGVPMIGDDVRVVIETELHRR